MNLLRRSIPALLICAVSLAAQDSTAGAVESTATSDSVLTVGIDSVPGDTGMVADSTAGALFDSSLVSGVSDSAEEVPVYVPSPLELAYYSYLRCSYDSSLTAYKAVYEQTGSRDGLYGMVNSLVMLKRYDEALLVCHSEKDPILAAKEAWIFGLKNDRSGAEQVASRMFSVGEKAVILRSGGDGFYVSGNFREAAKWYRQAETLAHDSATASVLSAVEEATRNSVTETVSLMGGPIFYGHNQISDQGDHYRYTNGLFGDIGSEWHVRGKTDLSVHYSRFDASFGENRFGVNRLYASLDGISYSIADSIAAWNSSDSRWSAMGPVLGSRPDTVWLLYEDASVLDIADAAYDTVVYFTPDHIGQNQLYLGVSTRRDRTRPILFGGSLTGFQSNMNNLNLGLSGRYYQGVALNHLTLGAHLVGTATEKVGVIQVSPELSGEVRAFYWRITPTYIWKGGAPANMNIPGVQLSGECELGATGKHIAVSGTGSFGRRAFVSESGGENIVTVSLPHRFTGSLYVAVTPKVKTSLFTLIRFESYEQLSRLISLGGVSITF